MDQITGIKPVYSGAKIMSENENDGLLPAYFHAMFGCVWFSKHYC